jgi:D-hexose-6-phosphate mutarotase
VKAFEDDLVNKMENIQFRNVSDKFLNNLDNDLKKVKTSPNVFVFADKTKNVYETTPENYNKIVKDNVTKTYKLTDNGVIE